MTGPRAPLLPPPYPQDEEDPMGEPDRPSAAPPFHDFPHDGEEQPVRRDIPPSPSEFPPAPPPKSARALRSAAYAEYDRLSEEPPLVLDPRRLRRR